MKVRETFVLKQLKHCARCGKNHKGLVFMKFIYPPDEAWQWWCPCPTNGDPILLAKIVEEFKDGR